MTVAIVIGAAILAICSVAVLIIMSRAYKEEEDLRKKNNRRSK